VDRVATINIAYSYGDCVWVVSDSSHELDDVEASNHLAVGKTVDDMRLELRRRGFEVEVKWPPSWPPDDEELWDDVAPA
jgi:hypothetical protein